MGMMIDKAIPKLQFVRNALNDDMEIAKAYDLAIETMRKYQKLEQEPTTTNDLGVEDCVSRAEVLKLMKDNWHTHNGDWAMQESMDDIRALPSVTPQEPKTGHWEHGRELGREYQGKTLVDITYEDWHCSNCHCAIEQSSKPKWSYCPSCGAKMVEPQESEDKE